MTTEEIPESYNIAIIAGVQFSVSDDVRKELEWFAQKGTPTEILVIPTLCHEEVSIAYGEVEVIYSTTPASRRMDALMQKRNDKESDYT